jgi:phosphonate transport system substrate-binding protein
MGTLRVATAAGNDDESPWGDRRRFLTAAAVALLAPLARAADAMRPFEIGVMPYLSVGQVTRAYQPLRLFIEETFRRPAVISTAPDFPTFQQRTLAGEYDLIVTGPPLAWQAQKEGKITLIAVADRPLRMVVVVGRAGPIREVAGLRGGTLAVIAPPSFALQIATDMLRQHGLKAGVDVAMRYDTTPFNSVKSVALGEVTAAAYPTVSLPTLPRELLDQVRTLEESQNFPSVTFSIRRSPDLPGPEEMQKALLHFVRDTEAGRAFVAELGHDGLSAPDMKALRILDRFLP